MQRKRKREGMYLKRHELEQSSEAPSDCFANLDVLITHAPQNRNNDKNNVRQHVIAQFLNYICSISKSDVFRS